MRPIVLDSTALVAFCDPDAQCHRAAKRAFNAYRSTGVPFVVPVSVLADVLVGAFRSTPHAVKAIEGFVDELVSDVRPVDRAVAKAAAMLRAEHPDLGVSAAYVLATGTVVEAAEIVTTQQGWRAIDERVKVLFPGGPAPEEAARKPPGDDEFEEAS